jgi:protein phosphatase
MMTLTHAGLSDPGRTHDANQDRWLIDPAQGLYLVSDGMAEDVSPQIVVDTLPEQLRKALAGIRELTHAHAADAVRFAIAEVSRKVHAESERREDMIGATIVLALVRGGHALIAHLGDSRAYLLRGGKLEPLTRDHSMLEQMIELGWITRAEASWRGNGGPSRYAGMSAAAEADVHLLELQPGDRLLLCSDGLTEMLDDDELPPLLAAPRTPEEACARLVAAANDAGGRDNITVIVVAVS